MKSKNCFSFGTACCCSTNRCIRICPSWNCKWKTRWRVKVTRDTVSSSVNRFSIGQEWDSTTKASDFFDGKIDEVASWNVALSAADVSALYNSGNGLKASANSGNYDNSGDLIGYWKFNDGTGSTLTDNTSNSNNGTLTNLDSSSDWVTSGSETKPSFQ